MVTRSTMRDEEVLALSRTLRENELQAKVYEDQQAALQRGLTEMEENLHALRDENQYLKERAVGPRIIQENYPEDRFNNQNEGPSRVMAVHPRDDFIQTGHASRHADSGSRGVGSTPTLFDKRADVQKNYKSQRVTSSVHRVDRFERVNSQRRGRTNDQGHRRMDGWNDDQTS